jgi:hypothetical protein
MTPAQCTSPEICQQHQCVSLACTNGQKDGTETDVDCGGNDCPACANGMDCLGYADCQSQFCNAGTGGAGGAAGTGGSGAWDAGGTGGAGGSGGMPPTGPGVCAACTNNTQCVPAAGWCDPEVSAGSCVAKKDDGSPCAAAAECTSGNCPVDDLVCCDAPCDGECEACAADKTSGPDGQCDLVAGGEDPDGECTAELPCGPDGTGCDGSQASCNRSCPSCEELYGAMAQVLEMCGDTGTECSLRVTTANFSCDQICRQGGGECSAYHNDEPAETCGLGDAYGCAYTGHLSAICICSHGCGDGPPCQAPASCNNGFCS